MNRRHVVTLILLALSASVYVALGYATPRTNFTQLLLLYAIGFAAYVYLVNQRSSVWIGIGAAIFFRLLLLFATPALSDDYFRFVWDGRLLVAGINPYLHLPAFFITDAAPHVPGITDTLFKQLNSPSYFSVYPPLAQGIFWLGAVSSPNSLMGSIIVIRVIMIFCEIGSILFLLRLLRKMGISDRNVLLYALNPLVILELTGNLHFEGIMIFFILLSLYLLFYQRVVLAGLVFGLSVGVKMLPLLFMPFIWRKLGTVQFVLFSAATVLTVIAISLPLITVNVLTNIFQSINLYFQQFEFNASFYYLLRWVGFSITGYNQIAVMGPLLSLVTLASILILASIKKIGSTKRLTGFMAAGLTLYLVMATTVHPWYITTLLALTVASHFRFAIVWSGLVILSYATYRTEHYTENLILVSIEYSIVFLWLLVELYLYRHRYTGANLK